MAPQETSGWEALAGVVQALRPHLSQSWAKGYASYTIYWKNQLGAGHYAFSTCATDHDKMIWQNRDNFTAEEQATIAVAHALLFL